MKIRRKSKCFKIFEGKHDAFFETFFSKLSKTPMQRSDHNHSKGWSNVLIDFKYFFVDRDTYDTSALCEMEQMYAYGYEQHARIE